MLLLIAKRRHFFLLRIGKRFAEIPVTAASIVAASAGILWKGIEIAIGLPISVQPENFFIALDLIDPAVCRPKPRI